MRPIEDCCTTRRIINVLSSLYFWKLLVRFLWSSVPTSFQMNLFPSFYHHWLEIFWPHSCHTFFLFFSMSSTFPIILNSLIAELAFYNKCWNHCCSRYCGRSQGSNMSIEITRKINWILTRCTRNNPVRRGTDKQKFQ